MKLVKTMSSEKKRGPIPLSFEIIEVSFNGLLGCHSSPMPSEKSAGLLFAAQLDLLSAEEGEEERGSGCEDSGAPKHR